MRQSYISLSFSDSGFFTQGNYRKKRSDQGKNFEVTGAGGFLITENAEGIDRYFLPDREIIVLTCRIADGENQIFPFSSR